MWKYSLSDVYILLFSSSMVAFMETNQMARKIRPELVHKNNNGGRIQQLCMEQV